MSGHLMDAPRCKAMAKQTGERCKRRPIPGGTVCVIHGGASPAARKAAELRLAQAEATSMLQLIWDPNAEPVTDPIAALQHLAGKLQHASDVLGARMAVAELDGVTGLAWTRVMRELRMSLEGMQKLDLASRAQELSEAQAAVMFAIHQRVLELLARELPGGLSPALRDMVVATVLAGLPGAVVGELE